MRISDWSSDVCSSDRRVAEAEEQLDRLDGLDGADDARQHAEHTGLGVARGQLGGRRLGHHVAVGRAALRIEDGDHEIGRASCRERMCPYVSILVVAGTLKKKT